MIRYIPNAKPFRLAAMNCHYIKFPLSYFLDRAEAYGFRCIELFGPCRIFSWMTWMRNWWNG